MQQDDDLPLRIPMWLVEAGAVLKRLLLVSVQSGGVALLRCAPRPESEHVGEICQRWAASSIGARRRRQPHAELPAARARRSWTLRVFLLEALGGREAPSSHTHAPIGRACDPLRQTKRD